MRTPNTPQCSLRFYIQTEKNKKQRITRCFAVLCLLQIVLLLKLVNTSAGVNKLLFTGEKRMALGAYINLEIALGGHSLHFRTASTSNGDFIQLRMDAFLHFIFPRFLLVIFLITNCSIPQLKPKINTLF